MIIYDELVLSDAAHLPFKDQCFHQSLAIEVLEHLNKDKGYTLLEEIERISEHVIISTPLEFIDQHEICENLFEKHVSRWNEDDFLSRGCEVSIAAPLTKILRLFDRFRRLFIRLFFGRKIRPRMHEIIVIK